MRARTLRPVDRVVATYNLVALAGWLPFASVDARSRLVVAVHVAVAAMFLVAATTSSRVGRMPPLARLLVDAYPLPAVALAWNDLGARHRYLHGTERNALVVAADRWLCDPLFAGHANLRWAPAMPVLSEPMQAAYFAFLPLLVALAVHVALSRDRARRQEGVLRIALTFYVCFMLYTLLPTDGPLELFPRYTAGIAGGRFFQLNLALRASGDSLGTAFPSSHVAGSVTLAWTAWRCCPRAVAWLYTGVAAAIVCAVIYTQNHFVADACAGLATALVLQGIVAPWLLGTEGPTTAAARPRVRTLEMA